MFSPVHDASAAIVMVSVSEMLKLPTPKLMVAPFAAAVPV